MTDDTNAAETRRTVLGGIAGLAATGAFAGNAAAARRGSSESSDNQEIAATNIEVTADQEPGKAVNWVLPGPRRLSTEVFGTPDNPMTGDDLIEHVTEVKPEMADLLEELPFPVGVPVDMRETTDDGTAFTVTTKDTPFSDAHEPTKGELHVTYRDRKPYPGFKQARDEVELDTWFEDPAGNRYTVELDHLEEEPGGGVWNNGIHHGTTGIGSPLMPKQYDYGAFWGVGTLTVNDGEQTWENREIHFMTTQMVRDQNYALALDEELPLDNPYLGRPHHTHGMFLPIEVTEGGPKFAPLDIPFQPDGKGQPFIHIMFDQDEVSVTNVE